MSAIPTPKGPESADKRAPQVPLKEGVYAAKPLGFTQPGHGDRMRKFFWVIALLPSLVGGFIGIGGTTSATDGFVEFHCAIST